MTDDGADEESVISDFLTFGHFGLAKIKVHFLIGSRKNFQLVSSQSIDFQLESQSRFQVTINTIFIEEITSAVGEELEGEER